MPAIQLTDELEQRLSAIAAKTGRSSLDHARQALVEHLDDLEDHYIALERLHVQQPTLSMNEMERRLGLAD